MPVETQLVDTSASNTLTVDLSQPAPIVEGTNEETSTPPEPTPNAPQQTEQTQQDPKIAAKFAALSRKENELRQRERQFKEQQAQIQAYQKAIEQAKSNPVALVQAAGYKDMEDYLKAVVNGPESEDPKDVRLKEIEQKIKTYEQQIAEAQQRQMKAQQQAQIDDFKGKITEHVAAKTEEYERIMEHNAIDDVFELIFRSWEETGGQRAFTIEEASKLIEDQLYQEDLERFEKLSKSKKLNKKSAPATKVEEVSNDVEVILEKQPEVEEQEWKVPNTLTNKVSSLPQPNTNKTLTAEERMARAIAKLRWTDD